MCSVDLSQVTCVTLMCSMLQGVDLYSLTPGLLGGLQGGPYMHRR